MKNALYNSMYYVDRLNVFDDSVELAQRHHQAAEDAYVEGGWPDPLSEETRDHILGLWVFVKECVDKIEELEAQCGTQDGA